MPKITQTTLVPLSFIVVIFGVAFWMSELRSATVRNVSDIDQLKSQSDKIDLKLDEMNERLSRIEGKLGNISDIMNQAKEVKDHGQRP